MKPPLGFGILELSEFKMENDFCENLERWSNRIESMLRKCVVAICEENNDALREEMLIRFCMTHPILQDKFQSATEN